MTKRKQRQAKQALINARCMQAIDRFNEVADYEGVTWERLDYCQAWIADIGEYKVLKSYNTLIALIYKPTGTMYDVLRYVYGYTATSAKHVSKFRRYSKECYTYYDVNSVR